MVAAHVVRQLPLLILVSFDGFRHDYLSPTLTPNLFDLSKQATIGHMQSMYVTKTFPNHFSMVTGLYEDEHEIINNKMFDPRLNQTFKPGVSDANWWNFKGTIVPIWTANQLHGSDSDHSRYSASMMYPGATTTFEGITPTHLRDYDKVRNWTDNVETVIDWVTDPTEPANFVSMYFDDPDSTAHTHGPWGEQTLEAVRRVDSAAGYLVKRLRDRDLVDKTNIIFVSDHGMAEVKKILYLDDFIDTSNFDLHGNSPDWSIFVKPGKRNLKRQIYQQLVSASKKNHYKVYARSEIPVDFHYSKSPRIGDFFLLVDEGYDIYKNRPALDPEPIRVQPWGNHGWDPRNRDMRPLFMAHGPSFRHGYHHHEPFPNIDLFPLMVFLLDLPAEKFPNNGSLARIMDIIDVGHFDKENESLKLAYIALLGVMMLMLSGVVFTLFASTSKPKYKPQMDIDELAPGLNIDLGFYLDEDPSETKKKRRKKEELLSLLR